MLVPPAEAAFWTTEEKSLSAVSPTVLALGGAGVGVCTVQCANMLKEEPCSLPLGMSPTAEVSPAQNSNLNWDLCSGGWCLPAPAWGSLLGAGPVSLVHQAAASPPRGNLELKLQPLRDLHKRLQLSGWGHFKIWKNVTGSVIPKEWTSA